MPQGSNNALDIKILLGVVYLHVIGINVLVLYKTYEDNEKCVANLVASQDFYKCYDALVSFSVLTIVLHGAIAFLLIIEIRLELAQRRSRPLQNK